MEFWTDERTLDRATLRAEFELLDQLALVLVRTSSRETDACATIVVFARTVLFGRGAVASRSCPALLTAPDVPNVPGGITGTTITGELDRPVALAGISTGPAETATTTSAGVGGGAAGVSLAGTGVCPSAGTVGAST